MLATHLYVGDSDDWLPHNNWDFHPEWPRLVLHSSVHQNDQNLQTGTLWKYLGDYKMYRCPLDRTNTALFKQRGQKYTSYILNGSITAFQIRDTTYKITAFRPDAIIMWQADEGSPGDFNDASSSPDHNIGTTVGVIDGHVEHIKIRDFGARQPSVLVTCGTCPTAR